MWLPATRNTAWGPGCYACCRCDSYRTSLCLWSWLVIWWSAGKERGYLFDGTCNGDGTGGRGQSISEILRTLTITITEWTYSTISSPTRTGQPNDDGNCDGHCGSPPRSPSTTVTRIVTVTNTSSSGRRVSFMLGQTAAGIVLVALLSARLGLWGDQQSSFYGHHALGVSFSVVLSLNYVASAPIYTSTVMNQVFRRLFSYYLQHLGWSASTKAWHVSVESGSREPRPKSSKVESRESGMRTHLRMWQLNIN